MKILLTQKVPVVVVADRYDEQINTKEQTNTSDHFNDTLLQSQFVRFHLLTLNLDYQGSQTYFSD